MADDILFVEKAIESHIDFEPFHQDGDVDKLFSAACNLVAFMREYEERTRGLKLPGEDRVLAVGIDEC